MFVQDSDAPPARNGLKRPNGSSAPRAAFWVITEMDVRGFFLLNTGKFTVIAKIRTVDGVKYRVGGVGGVRTGWV